MTAPFISQEVHATATVLNSASTEPGAQLTSPVNGVVVAWHIVGASGAPVTLRILRPAAAGSYSAVGSSHAETPTGLGMMSFTTALPIQAGDTIGLDTVEEEHLGVVTAPGAAIAFTKPPLADGATAHFSVETGFELGFNAVVQPQPTVTALKPASGSFKGGGAVTISGADFAGVSAVKFGATPATSFTVGSESSISAVAPPGAVGKSDVTVTTVAGTSPVTPADRFAYTACIVPKLKGKKLKVAKKGIAKAGCKLGKVTKKNGATAKSGKVVAQSPKPGKTLAPGAKVFLKLG